MCNNVITDEVLYQYMQVIGSTELSQRLFEEREWNGELNTHLFTQEQYAALKQTYTKEMQILIDRVKLHPGFEKA